MKWLYEFLAWKWDEKHQGWWGKNGGAWRGANLKLDWELWMTEVEPRIRERGLWDDYCETVRALIDIELKPYYADYTNYMAATLEQRAEALRRVLA